MEQPKNELKTKAENEQLRQENQALRAQIKELKEQIKVMQNRIFGTRSEKTAPVAENQLSLWDEEAGVFKQSELPDQQSTEGSQTTVQKPQKKRQKWAAQLNNIPVVKHVKQLDDQTCPFGQPLKKSAELYVVEEYVETYTCDYDDCFVQTGQTAFFSAAKGPALFAHSLASPLHFK